MMSKRVIATLFFLVIGSIMSLSNGQDRAKTYFETGEYKLAEREYEASLKTNPAEAHYYLGEIAYIKGDVARAKEHYTKGLASSSDFVLNHVGLGKIALKTDTKEADGHFSKAIAKNKKDAEVIIAIAKAYYANGMMADVEKRVADARKANKRSPYLFAFNGDLLRAQKRDGDAAGQYEQGINMDPNYLPLYIKLYQIYQDNIPTASEWLNMMLDADPEYMVAYKYMGDMYYKAGMFKAAAESYQKFITTNDYTVNDLTRYAASLYFSEDLDQAKEMIGSGLEIEPNSFILNRLAMYSALDSKQYVEGLEQAEKFFALERTDELKTISRDLVTYGKLLEKNDKPQQAIEELEKAIEMDIKEVEVYKDIASIYAAQGEMANAARAYHNFIKKAPQENITSLDYLYLGRNYYMVAMEGVRNLLDIDNQIAAGKTGLEQIREQTERISLEYVEKAKEAFTEVETRSEDSHLGPLYRARTASLLDRTAVKGLAKEDYEKTVAMLTNKEEEPTASINQVLMEAYQYLAFHYYMQYEESGKKATDKEQATIYCKKVLELDPGHQTAKQILEAM